MEQSSALPSSGHRPSDRPVSETDQPDTAETSRSKCEVHALVLAVAVAAEAEAVAGGNLPSSASDPNPETQ